MIGTDVTFTVEEQRVLALAIKQLAPMHRANLLHARTHSMGLSDGLHVQLLDEEATRVFQEKLQSLAYSHLSAPEPPEGEEHTPEVQAALEEYTTEVQKQLGFDTDAVTLN